MTEEPTLTAAERAVKLTISGFHCEPLGGHYPEQLRKTFLKYGIYPKYFKKAAYKDADRKIWIWYLSFGSFVISYQAEWGEGTKPENRQLSLYYVTNHGQAVRMTFGDVEHLEAFIARHHGFVHPDTIVDCQS
jgi:hypothetical protein